MRTKYKIFMTFIITLIGLLIIVEVGYVNFLKEEEQTMAMINVLEGLSINYLNGNQVKTNEDTYEINFSITNSLDSEQYYSIKLQDVEASDDVTYKLISKEEIFPNIEDNIKQKTIKNQIKIEAFKTQSYTLIFYNSSKLDLNASLKIEKEVVDNSLKSFVLKNNQIVTDNADGLVETTTDEGSVYYFKGNVANNYVSLANKLWRIVRINADGTVSMVLDDLLEEESAFFDSNESESTAFNESTIYSYLTSWYDVNLKDYDHYIANSKYCTDDNAQIEEEGVIYYLPEQRIFNEQSPVVSCPGTMVSAKIALMTADDVLLAGSYLNKEDITRDWWTMTLNKKDNKVNYYITANNNGLNKDIAESDKKGIRPVITIIKKLNTSGDGSIDNPYMLTTM